MNYFNRLYSPFIIPVFFTTKEKFYKEHGTRVKHHGEPCIIPDVFVVRFKHKDTNLHNEVCVLEL